MPKHRINKGKLRISAEFTFGGRWGTIDPFGKVSTMNINTANGLLMSSTDVMGTVTNYTYNANTDAITSVITGNSKVEYAYDTDYRLDTIKHYTASNKYTAYNFDYDAFGNTDTISVGNQVLIDHDYAANNGKLTKSTYGNGFYTENIYDSLDRVTGIKYNGVKRFGWDFNYKGQVGLHTDLINNQTFSYTYDATGRLTNVLGRSSGNMPNINFTNVYDSKGRLTDVNRKVGSTTISTHYEYEDSGRLDQETFNNGSSQIYDYDGYGRVYSKELETSDHANILTTTYTFRSVDDWFETTAMISSETLNGSNWSTTYGYTYYDDGNVYQITKNGELYATYYYDDLGQLTHAVIDDWAYFYHYDVGGNLIYKSESPISGGLGSSEIDYYYGNDQWTDLLTMYNDTWIDYDEIGNPYAIYGENDDRYLEWEGRKLTYLYDYIDDVEVYYTYNADGIRTQKEVNGVTTYYTLDGSKIISQKTGNVETFFEYDATGQVKCMTYNGATYYYVYNMLGDIVGMTNIAGNLVVSYKYHPYGEIKEYTDTSGINLANINPFRYKGYYFDTETGFYYCNSRYYDPELCRFLNADGYVSTGQGIIGFNMFAYCLNNPIIFLDKFGSSADMVPVYGPELPLHYQFKNQDGSYSLYDNHRNNPNSVFHEQILSLNADGGFNLTEGKVGFDASLTLFNGGWEFEHVDLSLLDVGKASLGIGYVDDFVGVTAQATAYAPSVTLKVFGYNVTLQLDVGSVGATAAYDSGKFTLSFALIFGGGISVSKKR